jgi:hypothetical protein
MYQILGILNVALFVGVTSPYWLRRINQWFFHGKSKGIVQGVKKLRKVHKPLGICLVVLSLIHGYLALGALRLHTGSLAWIMSIITVLLGVLFYKRKKAVYLLWHKRAALLTIILTVLHLVFPSALYYIFSR